MGAPLHPPPSSSFSSCEASSVAFVSKCLHSVAAHRGCSLPGPPHSFLLLEHTLPLQLLPRDPAERSQPSNLNGDGRQQKARSPLFPRRHHLWKKLKIPPKLQKPTLLQATMLLPSRSLQMPQKPPRRPFRLRRPTNGSPQRRTRRAIP